MFWIYHLLRGWYDYFFAQQVVFLDPQDHKEYPLGSTSFLACSHCSMMALSINARRCPHCAGTLVIMVIEGEEEDANNDGQFALMD